jgi:hypothetical protein
MEGKVPDEEEIKKKCDELLMGLRTLASQIAERCRHFPKREVLVGLQIKMPFLTEELFDELLELDKAPEKFGVEQLWILFFKVYGAELSGKNN